MEEFEARIREAEARADEAEANMMQAAQFGKELLERNAELESELEAVRCRGSPRQRTNSESTESAELTQQELHALQMKLEAQNEAAKSLNQEIDSLRSELASTTASEKANNGEFKALKAKYRDLEARFAEKELFANQLSEKVEILTAQLDSVKEELLASKRNLDEEGQKTFNNTTFTNLTLLDEKQDLEKEVLALKDTVELLAEKVQCFQEENRGLKSELEEKEVELSGLIRSLEQAREETSEFSVQIESMKIMEVDPKAKGNSLFSEVEDRRRLVENKLESLQAKNAELRRLYDEKVQQNNRIRLQNVGLLNMLSGGAGCKKTGSLVSTQIQRLEDLLTAEKNRNRSLTEQLASMTKSSCSCGESGDGGEKIQVAKEEGGGEYAYLSQLLKESRAEVSELKSKLQLAMKQSLEESDKVRSISRKLDVQEVQTSRLRAENYQLKIQIEDLKQEKCSSIPQKQKPRTIFEDIKFQVKEKREDKEEDDDDNNKKVLEEKENSKPEVMKKKKSVSLFPTVKVMEEETEIRELKSGSEEEKSEKAKKKPQRRIERQHQTIQVEEHDEKIKQECAQQ